jgi:hypothetical protein
MRGVQFSSDPYVENLRFRNNIIKTEVQDESTSIAPCVVAHGLSDRADTQLPIIYENNHFISNSVHVRFGDDYAIGGNHRFNNTTLTKFGSRSHYRTIQIGYWVGHTYNNLFVDTTLEGGANLEDNEFSGSGRRNYSVAHSLWIVAKVKGGNFITNQQLTIHDSTGQTYLVSTDSQGKARLELVEYTYQAPQGASSATKTVHSGHELRIDSFSPFSITTELFNSRNTSATAELIEFTLEDPNATIPANPTNLRIIPN